MPITRTATATAATMGTTPSFRRGFRGGGAPSPGAAAAAAGAAGAAAAAALRGRRFGPGGADSLSVSIWDRDPVGPVPAALGATRVTLSSSGTPAGRAAVTLPVDALGPSSSGLVSVPSDG